MSPGVSGRLVEVEHRRLVDPCPHLLGQPVGILPTRRLEPALLAFVAVLVDRRVANGFHSSTRPGRSEWCATCGGGGSASPSRRSPTSPITASTTSSTGCAERKLAAIDRSRNSRARDSSSVAQLLGALRGAQLAHLVELVRVGALEAVDRLLEVADHEQGADAAARPSLDAAEIFFDQLLDDLPLRGIGVLRLVDQHMVDCAVELVADPVAHSGLASSSRVQSIRSLKSATPARAWRGRRRPRRPARRAGRRPCRQASRAPFWICSSSPIRFGEPPGMRLVMRLGLGLPGGHAQACPCRSARPCAARSERRRARSASAPASRSMTSACPRPVCAPQSRLASATARRRSQSKRSSPQWCAR